MRVIIADDSELIRERLEHLLSNYSRVELVGSFNNGKEAYDAIKDLKPELAILDNKMPGLSGLEVVKEIRKETTSPIIIILTFHSTDFYRQLAMEAGADYFLSKVDEFEKLELVLKEILNDNRNYSITNPEKPK